MGNASGASLGEARGRISVDTSDLQRAVQTARTAGRQIEQSFSGIDRSTKKAELSIQSLGGTLGVAFGAQQVAQFITRVDELATAYARQSVAALSLAGSQEKLNALLLSYDKVTGGVIGKAATLSDVTQLQAIGFADTTAELERFVTAARGISLATGRSQDFVVQQLQLAIANQSTLRLDQIGLGVEEVKSRISELKAANSSLSDEIIYQNAVLGLAEQKYGALTKSAEAQATGLEKARKSWADLSLEIGEAAGPATSGVMTGLTAQIRGISEMLRGVQRDAIAAGNALQGMGGGKKSPIPGPAEFLAWDPLNESIIPWMNNQLGLNRPALPTSGARAFGNSPSDMLSRVAPPPEFTGDQLAAQRAEKLAFEQETQEIERNAQEQRLDATRSYESQRTSTIASYERTIAREAEDFGRQRARAQAQFQKQIAELAEDAAKREADMAEDLADKIADLQEDSADRIADAQEDTAKRISEINEDYAKNREKAERTHKENLLDAAARLDATAVFNEQKRFARESQDAKDAHDEQISDAQEALQERREKEAENLAERIADEQEAHQKRLQDAREADQERLSDMQEDFAEQQRLADEDRAVRLQRLAEDHAAQLAEMDSAHALRLQQINDQAEDERTELEKAHLKEMEALGVVVSEGYKRIADLAEAAFLKSYDDFVKEIQKRYAEQGAMTPSEAAGLDPWRGGNLLNPVPLVGPQSTRSGGGGRSLTIAPGGIVVNAAPGQNAEDIATTIDRHLIRRFQELSN